MTFHSTTLAARGSDWLLACRRLNGHVDGAEHSGAAVVALVAFVVQNGHLEQRLPPFPRILHQLVLPSLNNRQEEVIP